MTYQPTIPKVPLKWGDLPAVSLYTWPWFDHPCQVAGVFHTIPSIVELGFCFHQVTKGDSQDERKTQYKFMSTNQMMGLYYAEPEQLYLV
jgi:hypothetical protein